MPSWGLASGVFLGDVLSRAALKLGCEPHGAGGPPLWDVEQLHGLLHCCMWLIPLRTSLRCCSLLCRWLGRLPKLIRRCPLVLQTSDFTATETRAREPSTSPSITHPHPPCCHLINADFTATETREREPSISREVTSKAGRTPVGGSPAKPAAGGGGANVTGGAGAATQPLAAGPDKLVGQVKGASAGAAGIEMAGLKKEL